MSRKRVLEPQTPEPQQEGTVTSLGLLTPEELAAELGMSVGTLRNWRSTDTGPAYISTGRSAGSVRYRVRDVERWLDRQRRTTSQSA